MTAPFYGTEDLTKGSPRHFYGEASTLANGTKGSMWGWAKGYDNAGAWFTSHRTGHYHFFEIMTVDRDNEGDIRAWVLKSRRVPDFLITIFND